MSYDSYRPGGFGGFQFFPPVIKNLLIINVGMYLLQFIAQGLTLSDVPLDYYITRYLALWPITPVRHDLSFMPWQLLTYQFLHGNFSHIFFNMLMLWMFGMEIETLWGSRRFLLFYLAAGIGGGLLQLLLPELIGGLGGPTIGASGAIFGVMIAFGMLFPDRYIYIYFLLPVKAKYMIGFMVIINLLAVNDGSSNVAHLCHIGGAITGFLYMMFDSGISFNLKDAIRGNSRGASTGSFFKSGASSRPSSPFSSFGAKEPRVQDASFYDINEARKSEEAKVDQEEIDAILDKISQSGYKNLSEREKRVLFEASKRMQNE